MASPLQHNKYVVPVLYALTSVLSMPLNPCTQVSAVQHFSCTDGHCDWHMFQYFCQETGSFGIP